MPKIDVTRFMEQSGMRKARFGGYEPDDVRAALQALCTEYEQRLGRAEAQARKAEQENAALQRRLREMEAGMSRQKNSEPGPSGLEARLDSLERAVEDLDGALQSLGGAVGS